MRINFRYRFLITSRGHFRVMVFHVCTKFCENMFFQYADISILRNSIVNMAAVRHLGFVEGSRGTTHEGQFMMAIP